MASKKQELRISEIISLQMELEGLLSEDTISFGLKYDLSKLLKKVKNITTTYNEVRQKVLDKFGTLSEDGKTVTFEGDNKELGDAEMKKINSKKESFSEKFDKADFESLKSNKPYYVIMSFIE